MTKLIDILGSCVTRDAFAFVENDYEISRYNPRSSLISLYSPPLKIKKEGINLKSEYQQRLVYNDFSKEFRRHLKNTNAETIIIDLIDERLGVLKTNGTYITNSEELKNSTLKRVLDYELLPFDSDYIKLWELSALQFIHDIRDSNYKHTVLHKSYYVNQYIDSNGLTKEFTNPERVKKIKQRNEFLHQLYNFLEINIENIISVA